MKDNTIIKDIPKVIHYCWFGNKPLPKSAQKCIDSWKKFCPEYEIKRWGGDNYNYTKCKYMHQAYEAKKYAFVSDYARFDIIYNYGGIYLDIDVEIIKNFDFLLDKNKNSGFMGFEGKNFVASGLVIAGVAGLEIFKQLRDFYNDKEFINKDGSLNMLASPHYTTNVLLEYGLDLNKSNQIQQVANINIYPSEFFCPLSLEDNKLTITQNTFSIHHYFGTWVPLWYKYGRKIFIKIFGVRFKNFLRNIIKK